MAATTAPTAAARSTTPRRRPAAAPPRPGATGPLGRPIVQSGQSRLEPAEGSADLSPTVSRKGKPVVRRGRKARGLASCEVARLPTERTTEVDRDDREEHAVHQVRGAARALARACARACPGRCFREAAERDLPCGCLGL